MAPNQLRNPRPFIHVDCADFAAELAAGSCRCGVHAEPLCDALARRTYANPCRAAGSGVPAAQLISGPCASLEWATCSPIDDRTCVFRKAGERADRTQAPVLRF